MTIPFVTNSSSSSYVCEICGASESGMDMSIGDAGMVQCENGHTICFEEMNLTSKHDLVKAILEYQYKDDSVDDSIENKSEDDLIDMFMNFDDGQYSVPECLCPICQFIEYSQDDLSRYLLSKYQVSRDLVFDEVKKTNKRRKKLYENEYITYVCNQFNLSPSAIVSEWKDEFGSYSKFKEFLREMK